MSRWLTLSLEQKDRVVKSFSDVKVYDVSCRLAAEGLIDEVQGDE